MNNTSIMLLVFFIIPVLSIKILSIGDVEEDEEFKITIKKFPPLMTSQFSFCWWMKIASIDDFQYLGTDDDTSIEIWNGVGQPFWVNDIWTFSFPRRLQIAPHIWIFICIISDKTDRTMEFYLNSERMYEEEMTMFFDNFEWETEFLSKNLKFMGLWSGDLTEEDIASLYSAI